MAPVAPLRRGPSPVSQCARQRGPLPPGNRPGWPPAPVGQNERGCASTRRRQLFDAVRDLALKTCGVWMRRIPAKYSFPYAADRSDLVEKRPALWRVKQPASIARAFDSQGGVRVVPSLETSHRAPCGRHAKHEAIVTEQSIFPKNGAVCF